MSERGEGALSVGPKRSRRVRILLYLGEGMFGGIAISVGVNLGYSILPESLSESASSEIGLLAIGLLLLLFKISLLVATRRAQLGSSDRFFDEWRKVRRWPIVVGIALLAGAVMIVGERWYLASDYASGSDIFLVGLIIALSLMGGAYYLGSEETTTQTHTSQ